jgi:prepilin-type N-terminal cleavage/methylation domain-containing protein
VKPAVTRCAAGQDGFTLVEVIVTLALGVILLSAVSSVVLTSWRGAAIASSRVVASSQMRNFQTFAYDDFAKTNISSLGGCTPSTPGSSPITLPTVKYAWDGSNFLDRATSETTIHAATNVSAFSWYIDGTNCTVVIKLTVTVPPYSQSQSFRFYPRVNS